MMNVDERILMEAIELRTRQEMRARERAQYPDDYFDFAEPGESAPPHPATYRVSLKPDELALHQKLLEIARANVPAPSESFVG